MRGVMQEGVKQVPALFKAKVATTDEATISLQIGYRYGYIVYSDLGQLSQRACRIYPTEAVAKASNGDQKIVKVKVEVVK